MSLNSHQHTIRVYYEDTDAGGIVYYANYLKFFERARTEWLRALGINQSIFLEQNIGFVVTKVVMDNKASAKLDDLLTTTTTINQLKSASVVFSQQLVNQNELTLCTVEIKVACVDLSVVKPCIIPKSILGALKRVS
ncbi:tol-pal system-associated acyl-CoA thioesterase [Colwellia sp. M166]|uniref:tol-pal system-associated acyl-CoA thioesterase n=1 Tax=Colwellia sp. M166 TaxID=2583805 RepID=UPI00211EA6D0|nr:tol-pal system-associated acyl-CoA thioesterase [Colwellia sp. M166]UUO24836.1 tol-pal system-associated acyl-CoA thioesterase [Colwellia sp. M166]|tara:strand:- start:4912 stop:5322 length:411 start_codon:yes stop_codon:yes gene_type:complete